VVTSRASRQMIINNDNMMRLCDVTDMRYNCARIDVYRGHEIKSQRMCSNADANRIHWREVLARAFLEYSFPNFCSYQN